MIYKAIDQGGFHDGVPKGVINLLPKDGDHMTLNNWWLITLLTTIFKESC